MPGWGDRRRWRNRRRGYSRRVRGPRFRVMLFAVNIPAGFVQVLIKLCPFGRSQLSVGLKLLLFLADSRFLLFKSFGFFFGQFTASDTFADPRLLGLFPRLDAP